MEQSIVADLNERYGLAFDQAIPVTGGWLNGKWRISTEEGDLLVKQFSGERFGREQLNLIEEALQRQAALENSGVPCPYIRRCEGRVIRLLNDEIAYMVMEFCPGSVQSAETISTGQMRSLGSACALMHKVFSRLPERSVNGFPISGSRVMDALWTNYRTRMRDSAAGPAEYQRALRALEPVLEGLTKELFDKLPKGIAHEDFTSDNILFDADGVTAIVDFDRNQYSYLWHDVGRAILSFAWRDGQIDIEKAQAFTEGYSRHLELTLPDIADALRISWCMEVPWWIQPEFFAGRLGKADRFKNEILWVTEHWFQLDSLLCS